VTPKWANDALCVRQLGLAQAMRELSVDRSSGGLHLNGDLVMQSIRALVSPLLRYLAPAAAAAMVLTGVAGGEKTASAREVELITTVAPPAPRVEVVSAAPDRLHFWAPGYWGGYTPTVGHRWYPGQWLRYRPGYTFYQPGWVRVQNGWSFNRGGWIRGGSGGWHGGWCHH
jgi:hypothetical protein